MKCLNCDKISRTFDFFLDITLPIKLKKSEPETIVKPKVETSKGKKKTKGKRNKPNKIIIINDDAAGEQEESNEKNETEQEEEKNEETNESEKTIDEAELKLKEIENEKKELEKNKRFYVVNSEELVPETIVPYFDIEN